MASHLAPPSTTLRRSTTPKGTKALPSCHEALNLLLPGCCLGYARDGVGMGILQDDPRVPMVMSATAEETDRTDSTLACFFCHSLLTGWARALQRCFSWHGLVSTEGDHLRDENIAHLRFQECAHPQHVIHVSLCLLLVWSAHTCTTRAARPPRLQRASALVTEPHSWPFPLPVPWWPLHAP